MVLSLAAGTALAGGLSALGGLASSGLGMMMANGSQLRQYEYNKKLQQQQAKLNYNNSMKYAKNSSLYGSAWQRAGLENAGYNPMLAVQNGTTGVNSSLSSSAGASSVGAPDYQGAINAGLSSAMDIIRLKNETQQTESNINANESMADKNRVEAEQTALQNKWIDEETRARIGQMSANTTQLEAQTDYTKALMDNIEVQNALQKYGIDKGFIPQMSNASTLEKQYYLDKEIQDIARDKEKRYKEWGKKHPYWRNIDETLSRYFSGASAGAHASFNRGVSSLK